MTRKQVQNAPELLAAAEFLLLVFSNSAQASDCQAALDRLRKVVEASREPLHVDNGPEIPFTPLDKAGKAQLNMSKLPNVCWTTAAGQGKLSMIRVGINGHDPVRMAMIDQWMQIHDCDTVDQLRDKLNSQLGVTKNQRLAMECGSMFGWHVPGADPNAYNKKIDRPEQLIGK